MVDQKAQEEMRQARLRMIARRVTQKEEEKKNEGVANVEEKKEEEKAPVVVEKKAEVIIPEVKKEIKKVAVQEEEKKSSLVEEKEQIKPKGKKNSLSYVPKPYYEAEQGNNTHLDIANLSETNPEKREKA